MAIGDSYAELSDLKDRLNVTDTTFDTQLTSVLAAVSRAIEAFCHRQFNTDNVATARTYYPVNAGMVHVDDFHVDTGLVVETDDNDDGTFETTWDSSDYQLEPLNRLRHGETWPWWRIKAVKSRDFPIKRRATVSVTAQWGWSSVPESVREACLIMASETFKLKDAPFGVAGFGDFGVVRVRDNPKAASLLVPYRHRVARVA